MSDAIAPPTVTKRVPGTTIGNQPSGTSARISVSRLTPASTVHRPFSRSSSSTRSRPVQRHARRRPRSARRRRSSGRARARARRAGPAPVDPSDDLVDARAATTRRAASARCGPSRSAARSAVDALAHGSAMDGDRERHGPDRADDEQRPVAESTSSSGAPPLALFEQQRVPQDRRARTGTIESSNHVGSPTRRRLLERPQAVREDRDARRHRAHVAEERLRVQVERRAGGPTRRRRARAARRGACR